MCIRDRVVIVGGGVIGCSIAYHLTKRGWDDVVLLERNIIPTYLGQVVGNGAADNAAANNDNPRLFG